MPTYDLIVEAYMPNLENFKKQAKLILRWHRERHYPVAAQIRAYLPRFQNMPDSSTDVFSWQLVQYVLTLIECGYFLNGQAEYSPWKLTC
jgi:hypothetical protein